MYLAHNRPSLKHFVNWLEFYVFIYDLYDVGHEKVVLLVIGSAEVLEQFYQVWVISFFDLILQG